MRTVKELIEKTQAVLWKRKKKEENKTLLREQIDRKLKQIHIGDELRFNDLVFNINYINQATGILKLSLVKEEGSSEKT